MRGPARGILAGFVVSLAVATGASAADPVPYEDRGSSFRNILPPGSNGRATAADIAAFMATGQRPPHNDDQLSMYEDLVYATPGLKRSEIDDFFKDASFGVPPGEVEREYDPCPPLDPNCPDVVIQRDEGFGVPHISGETRSGAMFGAGYVAAEDRLFFIDALRHVGRAQLSSFAGGSPANRAMDREQWSFTPYTENDLQRQIDQFDELYGSKGAQLQEDLENYVDGVNAYIDETKTNPTKMPGEYAAINQPQGAEEWKGTDVVAIAALVGGIFGKGGGREVDSSLVLQAAQKEFGSQIGEDVWSDFRSAEDPEAPTTVHDERFPYQKPPSDVDEKSLGIPDRGSVEVEPVVESSSDGQSAKVGAQPATDDALGGALAFPSGNSNALVVSGSESSSGHPLAVFGPQTGYFAPQILMEQDIHAPATSDGPPIDARGVSFPGTNLYVQLGRGDDYSWSATSAGQDNVDTFAVDLCDPNGGEPGRSSRFYEFRGDCLQMEALKRTNEWEPNAADQTPPGSETLRTFRTKLGLVSHRGKIDGDPVAYTSLRSTYLHEIDSAVGFADFNNPDEIDDAGDYQRAAFRIGYTFNWLYVDDEDIAYFNSGNNPERADDTDPNFPTRGKKKYEWDGYKPNSNLADYTPYSEHPQVVNQEYLTSWNNKQAPAHRASDSNFGFSSVYRSQPLDDRIEDGIEGGREMSLQELIDAAEDAGTVDLRGDKVVPLALKVLGDQKNDERAAAIDDLRAWVKDGAHRRDRDKSGSYEHSRAIQILDAWWPILIKKEFKPELGGKLYDQLTAMIGIDNDPNNHGDHLGSAYQDGWYGYASRDLRTVLGKPVEGEYSREYCGRGQLSRCRERLEKSLSQALKNDDPAELYSDDICDDEGQSGDQMCFDKVYFRPLGAITQPLIHWINRPTFQQAVEIRDAGAGSSKREGRRLIGPQEDQPASDE